jgi:protein TonB
MTVQCAVAGLLIAIPLLRPQMLDVPRVMPPLALPFLHKPPVPVEVKTAASASTTMSLPAAAPVAMPTQRFVFPRPGIGTDADAPVVSLGLRMGTGDAVGLAVLSTASSGTGPAVVVVKAKEPALMKVSQGVSQGLLLTPIQPVYPQIARAVRMQGAVVIEAVISKAGRIESANVVSGPPMLRQAALDAVVAARYRPYLLNGAPTEVKTTYTVVFSLGS